MQDRELIEKLLEEQKIERKHQREFIERLKRFYDELDKHGFKPLGSLRQMISNWEQNLSLVERQIKTLEDSSGNLKKGE